MRHVHAVAGSALKLKGKESSVLNAVFLSVETVLDTLCERLDI